MNMPQGYEQAQVQGERELPELGGHHMIIKNVKVSETKTGKKMIVVSFDFASNDRQPEFFMKAFKADTREDKKWPRRGTQYIVVTGNDGLTSRGYKTFCTCYENSNGAKVKWVEDDEAWCAQFKNKNRRRVRYRPRTLGQSGRIGRNQKSGASLVRIGR